MIYKYYGCKGLTSIVIGNSVTSIDEKAFGWCTGLKHVYCYAKHLPTTYKNIFDYTFTANATLHVPANILYEYLSIFPWSEFGTIMALTDEDPNPSSAGMLSDS